MGTGWKTQLAWSWEPLGRDLTKRLEFVLGRDIGIGIGEEGCQQGLIILALWTPLSGRWGDRKGEKTEGKESTDHARLCR